MEYKLEDLIDIQLLQNLQDKLNSVYSFPSAIIDNEGSVLTAVAWQDICTKFHRTNPECLKECIKSDQYILEHLAEANPAVSYLCPHGMTDNATPIIIDGKHLGNFFTGQFFLEEPDLQFFKKQAKKYGFDEKEYMAAVAKVPIWSKEKLTLYLDFIKGFIEIIAGIGHNSLKEIESRKKIKETEERNSAIIQSTYDWIWEIDERGKYCYCSNRIGNILGYTVEEIIGKTPFDFMPKEERERVNAIFQNFIETKSPIVELENWNLHKDGHLVCLLTNGSPIIDETGKLIGYRGADKDITERKNAELKLKKSELKYRSLIESTSDAIFCVDEKGEYQFVNQLFASTFGKTPDYFIGKTFWDVYDKPHADMRFEATKRIFQTGESESVEVEVPLPDKTLYFLAKTNAIKDENGKVLLNLTHASDITSLKTIQRELIESNQFNLQIINSALEGIVVYDNNLNYLVWNPFMENLSGIPAKEVIGKHPLELFPFLKDSGAIDILEKAIKGEKNNGFDFPFTIPSTGKRGWASDFTAPLYNSNHEIIGAISTVRDITESKQIAEKISEKDIQFRKLSTHLPDLIYQFTRRPDGTYFVPIASEGIKNIFGCSPEDVMDDFTPIVRVIHPGDLTRVIRDIEYSAKHLTYFTCEFRVQIPGKTIQWIYSRSSPEKLSDGSVTWYGFNADITQKKQVEEELQSVKTSLELCLEASQIGIWRHDLIEDPEHIKEVSVRDLKHDQIFGYKEKVASWGQEKMLEHVIDEDREATRKAFDNVFEKGRLDFECRILWPDNTIHWIACRGKVYKDSAGQPNQINGTVMDITEAKLAEQDLIIAKEHAEENETRFKAISEEAMDGIALTDINGNYVFINPSFCKMVGYSKEELLSMNVMELKPPEVEPSHMAKLKNQGINYENNVQLLCKNKSTIFVELNAKIIEINKEKMALGIMRDITEKIKIQQELIDAKEKAEDSEYRLKLATASGRLGIWDWNLIENSMDWNDRMFELYGITKDTFPKNVDAWINGLHPEDKHKAIDECNAALNGECEYNTCFRVLHPDGKVLHLKADGTIIRDEAGKPLRMIGLNKDISETKLSEEQLLKAKERAEESDRLKSAFLANMSHEIRTPMNGILGFSELMKEPGLSGEEQREYIKIIEKSGARMLNILSEIIDISKIESGQMEVSLQKTNINEILKDACIILIPDANSKRLELSFKSNLSDKETITDTDRDKLYSILTNLVKNAIKYTDKGSIVFGCEVKDEAYEFFVKDTGIGIPKNRQEAIFERFIQADIVDIQARQGAGLGLSIAKAFVEMLGGRIWVESEVGVGSTFYFTLPNKNASPKFDVDKSAGSNPNLGITNSLSVPQLKILIVEDDETSEVFLSILTKGFSRELLQATDGLKAIEICRNNPDIDLILMDIKMPKMGGYEATRQIRQFNKDVIIIAQTAYGLFGDREKSLEAGCNDHISKPIKSEELKILIMKYFNN